MYSCVCVCVCQSHASFSSVKQRELFVMKKMNKFCMQNFFFMHEKNKRKKKQRREKNDT